MSSCQLSNMSWSKKHFFPSIIIILQKKKKISFNVIKPLQGRSSRNSVLYRHLYCNENFQDNYILWCFMSGYLGFPCGSAGKESAMPAFRETWIWSLVCKEPLEKGKAIYSCILAWKIPWTVYFMGSQRVGLDWMTFTFSGYFTKWSI